MDFDEYQKVALTTAFGSYDDKNFQRTIWAMGIAGEAGEVIEKWKKIVAYKDGKYTKDELNELKKELGDVVWYIAVFAESLGLSLNDVMQLNVKKLQDRKKRGVIKSSGDNR